MVVSLLAGCSFVPSPPTTASGSERLSAERLFALEVEPLLAAKCFACHGQDPDAVQGGLRLTSREAMLRGGASSQAVLVPGDADASLLYQAVRRTDAKLSMPPLEQDRLAAPDIAKIRAWIAAGAPWPETAETRVVLHIRSWDLAHTGPERDYCRNGMIRAGQASASMPEVPPRQ